MASQRAKRIVAFWLSVFGHALVVVALTFSISLSSPEQPFGVIVPIETVMVDQAALDARAAEIEAERQAEIRRQQDEARRVQREEQVRQERLVQEQRARETAERERIRLEAEARAQDEAERLAAEAEQRRQEELARQEAERRQREAEDARRREQIADEIAAAAAAEQQARAAADSGERARWGAMISNKVQQHWQQPPNATAGLECLLTVEQLITGEVRSVNVTNCNVSDPNIIRSLENAVRASSPLPARPPGVEFERIVRITFRLTE